MVMVTFSVSSSKLTVERIQCGVGFIVSWGDLNADIHLLDLKSEVDHRIVFVPCVPFSRRQKTTSGLDNFRKGFCVHPEEAEVPAQIENKLFQLSEQIYHAVWF